MPESKRLIAATVLATTMTAGDVSAVLVREDRPAVKVSGFADLVATTEPTSAEDPHWRINQVELGFETLISPRVGIFMAPGWDGEAFSLASVYIQFEEHSTDEYVFSRHLTGVGFIAGRFDVPFGIDWLTYPSIDRPLITTPTSVLGTHGAWNADGIMFLGCHQWLNLIVQATGGSHMERPAPGGGTVVWSGRHAEGGRLGFCPLEGFSCGGSVAIISAAHDRERRLWGMDAMLQRGALDLRAEYVDHRADAEGLRLRDEAWYVQSRWDFGPTYGIARWDVLETTAGPSRSLSVGAGVPVDEGVVVRGEFRAALDGPEADVFYLQLAAGF
ncbi:MAG: hypothetical protein GY838_01375 [bacterium]|nr:hypothetical protein [bacterium]